jgi:uncharacterized membrane protein
MAAIALVELVGAVLTVVVVAVVVAALTEVDLVALADHTAQVADMDRVLIHLFPSETLGVHP